MDNKYILINCPSESHKIKRYNSVQKEIRPVPKILFVASPGSIGEFLVQCPDMHCRRYNKERSDNRYNSWYRIVLNGVGGYVVESVPKQEFNVQKVPFIVIEDE